MIKIIVGIIIIVFPILAEAQEKLNKLKAPSSPASSILGLQPTAILSPKSYRSLETALFSNFVSSSSNSVIPNDFALEFTPYWTKNHGLSIQEYLYPNSSFDQFVRNSSFSIASTQKFLLGDSTSTNGLSFGYRTSFYFGNKKDREEIDINTKKLRDNQRILANLAAISNGLIENKKVTNQLEFIDNMKNHIFKCMNESGIDNRKDAEAITNSIITQIALLPQLDMNAPDEFLNSVDAIINNKLSSEKIFNEYKAYIKERYGFSVDFAYAFLLNFPTNQFEYSFVPRQSFWMTPAYRFEDNLSFLKILGVLRYERYQLNYYKMFFANTPIYENNIDYGFSISTEFDKFSLNFELVGRKSNSNIPSGLTDANGNELFRREQNSGIQYIGSFNYNLTDEIVVSYNLGNRFEPILNSKNTLVSMLSLNFGFGTPSKNDLDLEK